MKIATVISMTLVIIGAIVWMLVGLFNFNIVSLIFGDASVVSRVIYSLVGLSGLFTLFFIFAYHPFKTLP